MNVYLSITSALAKLSKGSIVCVLENNVELSQQCIKAGFELVDISSLLQTTASQIKYEFIDYITTIGKQQKHQFRWWASRIASKSNLQTDFFSLLCYFLVGQKIAAQNTSQHFLMTDERLFFLFVKNNHAKYILKDYLKASLQLTIFIFGLIIRLVLVRLYFLVKTLYYDLLTREYFVKLEFLTRQNLFIYSWVEERSFSNNMFKDQYLPDVQQFSYSLESVLFCPYYVKPHLYKLFPQNFNLLGFPQYSKIKYIIRSMFNFFYVDNYSYYHSNDLSILWLYEILDENGKIGFVARIHEYYCWQEFFQKAKGKFIYPYENQPWEKVMLLASKKAESKVTLIGYQHSAVGNLFLPYLSTAKELKYMPVPDMIITNSEANKKMFAETYKSTKTKILNGGALRYSSINKRQDIEQKKKETVGVFLPTDIKIAKEMCNELNKINVGPIKYIVKFHPDTIFKVNFKSRNIKTFFGSAKELYNIVDAVIYCNSSVGLEAVHYGIPVFKYQGQFLDLEIGENSFTPVTIFSLDDINENKFYCSLSYISFSRTNESVWRAILN